jgi:hypothetical protein
MCPTNQENDDLNHIGLLRTILILNVAILLGFVVDDLLADIGIKLPLFVSCMIVAIALTNTIPRLLPRLRWPSRTPSLALIRDQILNHQEDNGEHQQNEKGPSTCEQIAQPSVQTDASKKIK